MLEGYNVYFASGFDGRFLLKIHIAVKEDAKTGTDKVDFKNHNVNLEMLTSIYICETESLSYIYMFRYWIFANCHRR